MNFFRTIEDGATSNIPFFVPIITLVLIFVLTYKKSDAKLLGFSVLTLVFQLILFIWYSQTDLFMTQGLPFYHCRVIGILVGISVVFKWKDNFIIGLLAKLGIYTASAALFFADIGNFVFPHLTYFTYFIGHASIVIMCYLYTNKYPRKIGFMKAFLALLAYHLIIQVINILLNANYSYTVVLFSPINLKSPLNVVILSAVLALIASIVDNVTRVKFIALAK